jgi:hypothetical protein
MVNAQCSLASVAGYELPSYPVYFSSVNQGAFIGRVLQLGAPPWSCAQSRSIQFAALQGYYGPAELGSQYKRCHLHIIGSASMTDG